MRYLKDRMYEFYKRELKKRGERALALLLSASMVISPLCGTSIDARADEPQQPQEQTSTQIQTYVDSADNVINRVADPDTMTDGQSEYESMNGGQSEHGRMNNEQSEPESMYSMEHGDPTDLGENENRESQTENSDEVGPINDGTEILNKMPPATSSNAGINNENGAGMNLGAEFGILDDNSVVSPSNAKISNKYVCELDDGTVVTAVLDEGTELPEDAEFHAELLDEDEPRMTEVMDTLRGAMNLTEEDPMNFFPCDIYFTDADGNRIDIEGGMRVAVGFGSRFTDIDWGNEVYCLDASDNVEVLDAEWDDKSSDLEEDSAADVTKSGLGNDDTGLNDDGYDDVTESDLDSDVSGLDDDAATEAVELALDNTVLAPDDDSPAEAAESGRTNEDRDSLTFSVNSLSMTGLATYDGDVSLDPVKWGQAYAENNENVMGTTGDGKITWDLSELKYRYLSVPVEITVSGTDQVTITLDLYVDYTDNIRPDSDKVKITTEAVKDACTITEQDDTKIVLTFPEGDGGRHDTYNLPYTFDCWNVVSDREFSVNYKYQIGDKPAVSGVLTGKIKTGFDLEIVNDYDSNNPSKSYFNDGGRGNGYSLNEFAGADYITSYIQNYSDIYQKYFGLNQSEVSEFKQNFQGEKENYIYDIAPFLVLPKGQQPYEISGTVTLEDGGEVLGGLYMMDSNLGSAKPWKILEVTKSPDPKNTYSFTFGFNDTFTGPEGYKSIPLHKMAVTGNMAAGANVDNQRYTLYFLVRYLVDPDSQYAEKVYDVTNWNQDEVAYTPKATLSLEHTGVDSQGTKKTVHREQIMYQGPITESQIYDAYYYKFTEDQIDALSNLARGSKSSIILGADFFCFNEARSYFNAQGNDTYRLEAVIDLFYLTGQRPYHEKAERLEAGDYRIGKFALSLVDAPGNWSQYWHYEDNKQGTEHANQVWREQRPNVGWPEEGTWGSEGAAKYADGKIKVYASQTVDGDDWELIADIDAMDAWASDHGRGFVYSSEDIPENKNYVRLTVVYDSHWTTALRIDYQVELLPDILDRHPSLSQKVEGDDDVDEGLTAWINYFGYTKDSSANGNDVKVWQADTANMLCTRGYHSDAYYDYDNKGSDDKGTVESVREYDNKNAGKTKHKSEFNTDPGDNKYYSMRDYKRIILGSIEDQAGMLITQALYDTDGKIVGSQEGNIQPHFGSFCEQKEVTDVSEIVYSISGGITNGALSAATLNDRIKLERDKGSTSPFCSQKMRYFVLLPEGMVLNRAPSPERYDESGYDESGAENKFLSRLAAFYESTDKTIGTHAVLTSDSNIPAWNELSGNGYRSLMQWDDDGSVTLQSDTLVNGRHLLVFERTLTTEDVNSYPNGELFNLHGKTQTYFWGRGLSFSIVPEKGTGSLRAGGYGAQFWCQYLDKDGNAMSLEDFAKGTNSMQAEQLNNLLTQNKVDENTLLYIPSTFENKSAFGGVNAVISLESAFTDENGDPIVQFGEDYQYSLDFSVTNRTTQNVILWTNIEQKYDNMPEYRGTVTGVDLSSLPKAIRGYVRVFVNKEYFNEEEYISKNADVNWLMDEENGWQEVSVKTNGGRTAAIAAVDDPGWSNVKAVAFYFEKVTFDADYGPNSATVKVKMKAPSLGEPDRWLEKHPVDTRTGPYYAVSPLIFSDQQRANESNCSDANDVIVHVFVYQISITKGLEAADGVKLNDDDRNTEFSFTLELDFNSPDNVPKKLLYTLTNVRTVMPYPGDNFVVEQPEIVGTLNVGNNNGDNYITDNYITVKPNGSKVTLSFKLRGGQTFSLDGIPEGVIYTYTVAETQKGAFDVESSHALNSSDDKHTVTGQVTSDSGKPEKVKFTNKKRKPEPIAINLDLTKTVEDEFDKFQWTEDTAFTFRVTPDPLNSASDPLKRTNGQTVTVKGKENHVAALFGDNCKFTAAGTYKYYVSEKISTVPGISTDGTTYVVVVKVTEVYKAGVYQGKLIADVTVNNENSKVNNNLTFTNTYDPSQVQVPFLARKNFEGGELARGAFAFRLKLKSAQYTDGAIARSIAAFAVQSDEQLVPTPDPVVPPAEPEGQEVLQRNEADGTVNFGSATYTRPGVYTYEMREIPGEDQSITYDGNVYTITITIVKDAPTKALKVDSAVYTVNGQEIQDFPFFTNVKIGLGNLTVSKTVTGEAGDKTKEFHFTVAFDQANALEEATWNHSANRAITHDGNVLTFTLKHGESVNITNLQPGTAYTVTEAEANYDGYTTTIADDDETNGGTRDDGNGTIEANGTDTIVFSNSKPGTPPPSGDDDGSLTVTKVVSGGGAEAATKTYTFTVTGPSFPDGHEVSITGNGSYTLDGLKPGVYTVAETGDTGIANHTVTVTGGGNVTLEAGGTGEATVTNTYTEEPSAELTVTKVVNGGAEAAGKTYTFTVTGPSFPDGHQVTITGNASQTLTGLKPGTYTVTETGDAGIEGYTLKVTGGGNVTLTAGGTGEVTVTNTYTEEPSAELTVTKVISGGGAEAAGKTYTFTVTGPSFPNGHQITITGAGSETLTGLIPGTYTVTETGDAEIEDYTLTITGGGSVTLTAGGTGEVTVTNTYNKEPPDRPDKPDDHDDPDEPNNPDNPPVTPPRTPSSPRTPGTPTTDWEPPITPINPRTPSGPPRTGDDSNMSLWLALMAVSLVGAAVTLFFHRKKKDERKSSNN